jgi:thiol-disulfide isomerase/thioredoxin
MPPRRLAPALLLTLLAGCQAKPPALGPAPKADRPASPGPAGGGRTAPEPASELVEKGGRAWASGDLAGAARFLDQALAAEPANRKALLLLTQITKAQAESLQRPQCFPLYLKSADLLRRLRSAYPELTDDEKRLVPLVLYNEACTLALYGEGARAVQTLAESIEVGFDEIAHIERDTDLDPLRNRPDFQDLMQRLELRRVLALMAASKPFAFQFRLNDTDNKPTALADLKGNVTVVAFWGTWCAPCRKEVPHLNELYKRYHERGLAVVGLNYENEEGDEARKVVRAFVKENGIAFPCLIGDEATQNQVPRFEGYPTTLFLDRAGKVRLTLPGYQPLSALETAAAALLAEDKAEGARN